VEDGGQGLEGLPLTVGLGTALAAARRAAPWCARLRRARGRQWAAA